uniref:Molybdate-anion transporter n=1 Tax=Saccoglossus kowalevskii TaxID=10224 RepID=A0ABM0MPS6_SACKO|nr:PREDICTED: molybdate-anion transporter-like [Saccoglossus kowalevskii]
MVLIYVSFGVLSVLSGILHYFSSGTKQEVIITSNPTFTQFQRGYFLVYFLALAADWLQGPYLYKLYSYYGFIESQIAVLYVCGFASSVVFGTYAGILADKLGRKKLCMTFAVVYSVSCLTKLSRDYAILIVGRVLSGISTSLLFTAFEAWYVHEHVETHDFPAEWLPATFSKATFWNGILAIIAGIIANILAGGLDLGPVSPFIFAIPFLMASGTIVYFTWTENYGTKQAKLCKGCFDGLRDIVQSRRVLLIGIIQSLYESVMYIFVFLWTPILDSEGPPLGVIFSSFMICIMLGSSVFKILNAKRYPMFTILNISLALGLISMIICVGSSHPKYFSPSCSYIAFLILEFGCGMYFPAMGFLRSLILPEAHRAGIMNWFRVPLNLIACILLMVLHGDPSRLGEKNIFLICAILMSVAMMCGINFAVLVKDDDDLKTSTENDKDESITA